MDRLRVVLLDDEVLIRKLVRMKLNTEALHLEIVGIAMWLALNLLILILPFRSDFRTVPSVKSTSLQKLIVLLYKM